MKNGAVNQSEDFGYFMHQFIHNSIPDSFNFVSVNDVVKHFGHKNGANFTETLIQRIMLEVNWNNEKQKML